MKKVGVFTVFAVLFLMVNGELAAQATELRFGAPVSGRLRGSPVWYTIRSTEDGLAVIETTSEIDTYLEVYDADSTLLTENDDGGSGNNARVRFFARRGTVYRIKLRGYSSSETGPYRLHASIGAAPTALKLRFGALQSGELSAGDERWFSVRADELGVIRVETFGSKDTYLELYDASYKLLSSNDDGGEGTNAKVEVIGSAGQTYLARLSFLEDSESGPFRLTASHRPVTITDMRLGDSQSGNLPAGEDLWYRVRSANVGILRVETTGSKDTYLEVYDNAFKLLHSNDDGGSETNARIEFMSAANQTYLVRLKFLEDSESGQFRLNTSHRTITPTALRFDDPQSGRLAAGEDRWYSIRPTSAGMVRIETSGGMDTYLEVYDNAYKLLHEDDDGGSETNARIEFMGAANQTYLVRLKFLDSSESGQFRFSAVQRAITPVELPFGNLQAGTLDEGEDVWYSIRSRSAGSISVETFGSKDTYMEIYDSAYKLLHEDDDGGDDTNAKIEFEGAANQTYLIRIKFLDSRESGRYRVTASIESAGQQRQQQQEQQQDEPPRRPPRKSR